VAPDQTIQDAYNALSGQTEVDLYGKTLSREIIHDVQSSVAPAAGKVIRHKIERPSLSRPGRRLKRLAENSQPLALSDLQILFAVDPVNALVVDLRAFALQQPSYSATTKAPTCGSQVDDLRRQVGVIAPAAFVPRA